MGTSQSSSAAGRSPWSARHTWRAGAVIAISITAIFIAYVALVQSSDNKAKEPLVLVAARVPLINGAADPSVTFLAESDTLQSCAKNEKKPFGDITYSGLVKISDNSWVFLRDTKTCYKSEDPANKYFGIVVLQDGKLTAAEVEFDLSKVERGDRPTDLEAFCLIPGNSSSGSATNFEMIASESGGYKPRNNRRLFRLSFQFQAGRWHAVLGKHANYHSLLDNDSSVPTGFQVEGMLCRALGEEKYSITLADRGFHEKINDTWVTRRGGGLLPVNVDFSVPRPTVTAQPNLGYLEVVAPNCKMPDGWKVAEGEFRDISDLHVVDQTVWASAIFEGEIKADDGDPGAPQKEHFCSVVYKICTEPDCLDLYRLPHSRKVFGLEFQGRKIEGLADGADGHILAIASDEESRGAIDIALDLACPPQKKCSYPLRTARRTTELKDVVDKAQSQPDASKVLVVFDIDDTLLTMTQDLGGVAWYKWQNLINKGARPEKIKKRVVRVGRHTGELLDIQGILYALGDMKPTQPDTGELFSRTLKDSKITAYALTARGPVFENATRRELKKAGIEFPDAPECTGELCQRRGIIKGVDVLSYAKDVLKLPQGDLKNLNREVNINNGIMMVSGQDKGVMLRILLGNFPSTSDFETIVFVDDDLKNVIAVADAAVDLERNVYVYHYVRYEDDVEAFLGDKKRQAAAAIAWDKIRSAICEHQSMRWCEYPTT